MVVQDLDGSVEFRFYRPAAQTVLLAGEFNGWQKTGDSMLKDDSGWWSARLNLDPGEYQFRYYADGQWFNDYAAFGLEMGPFGWNSVARIVEPPAPVTLPDHERQAA